MAIRGNITDTDLTGPMQGKTLSDLISAIKNGDTYTNVHTPSHPDGEIRVKLNLEAWNAGSGNQTATVTVTDTGNFNKFDRNKLIKSLLFLFYLIFIKDNFKF